MYSPLGQADARTQEIIDEVMRQAHDLFPTETAKAEEWMQRQLLRYGIRRTKEAAQLWTQNPFFWFTIGIGGFLVVRGIRR